MKTITTGSKTGIQWTLWKQFEDLDFADNLASLSHNHKQMQDKTTKLATTSLGINKEKTKLMRITTPTTNPVNIDDRPIQEVDSFTYLGSTIDHQGGTDSDVLAKVGKARVAFIILKNIWASKEIATST